MTTRYSPNVRSLILGLALFSIAGSVAAQQTIRVPADQPTLQDAILTVADGGVIELAEGTYQAPQGGFTIFDSPAPKGFTVRAATGSNVILTGGGTTDILRFAPSTLTRMKPVRFENLTFANGTSTQNFIGGGMTLVNAQATFVSCRFSDNAANASGTGGGAQWIDSAIVFFDSCTWTGNKSPNYGAGMSVLKAQVFINNSSFVLNRVDLPGHSANAAGGALSIDNAKVHVSNTRFQQNQAGYVGGAIFAIGEWRAPDDVPSSDLLIENCLFDRNLASFDPSFGPPPASPQGGAIHTEAQTTTRIYKSRFIGNRSGQGGAVSNYLALTDIRNCVFQNNIVTGTNSDEGQGGAIVALSFESGPVNRRPAEITVVDSLIQGSSARQGGAIFAGGDIAHAFGLNGVAVSGSLADNRAKITLIRTAISDCAANGGGGLPGAGGALLGSFADFNIVDSLFLNCTSANFGGALELIQGSTGNASGITIAKCSAGELGAGITLFGSSLNLSSSNLIENRNDGGAARGVAITSAPSPAALGLPAFDITGLISNSTFSNNTGASIIYDGDRSNAEGPPFNRLQFSSNRFFPDNASTYFNDFTGPRNVAQLNNLVITRSDGTSSVKSPLANEALGSAPAVGGLLMVPPMTPTSGAPGESVPIPAFIAYAGSGGGITLDGVAQSMVTGVVQTAVNTAHTLRVGSTSYTTSPLPSALVNISTRLQVLTGDNVMIGGFIITGPVPKRAVIRAIGPSLAAAGVNGVLRDPTLEIFSGATRIARNDNWRDTIIEGMVTSLQAISLEASRVPPTSDAESAVVLTLAPGAYTAIVSGAAGGTGVGLVEVYDLDAIPTSSFANISTRGFVQTGENVLIGGFIAGGGDSPGKVLVRALGPSLTQFGIANPLANPSLSIFDRNGTRLAENDNWRSSQEAQIIATTLQPNSDLESAVILENLPRGGYTGIVSGVSEGTGVAIVEAYAIR